MPPPSLIIVGAGPTGLTAAIEVARRGGSVTILERNAGPTDESRAVGVNQQSLRLLAESGAAKQILSNSETLRAARIMFEDRLLARLELPQPATAPPPMVALPQSKTERILVEALSQYGVTPGWNTAVSGVEQTADSATAILESGERISADYLLGAGGSRSIVRKALDIPFRGKKYDADWSLMDVVVDWPFPDEQACGFLYRNGAVMFVITLGNGRYRAISDHPQVEDRLAARMPIKQVLWKNDFTVSLRSVTQYGKGRVWIAGDAAHVHTPVGGMGMNLGIEDACDFAETICTNQPAPDFTSFEKRRLKSAARVLRVSDRGYRMVTLSNPLLRMMRNTAIQTVAKTGWLRNRLFEMVFRAEA